jgi:hypothetical protein
VLKLQPYVEGSKYPEVLECNAHIDDLAALSGLVNLEELQIICVVVHSTPEWFRELRQLKVGLIAIETIKLPRESSYQHLPRAS